jgi:glycerate kinase
MITAALDRGCRHLLITVGGSATNDGGSGMMAALGLRLLDAEGQPVPPCGGNLGKIAAIDVAGLDPRLSECTVTVATDVTNPLCGKNGASYVYGPQKGADPSMIMAMDRWLGAYADLAAESFEKADKNFPGTGAAGGLGYAFRQFLDARLERGVDMVLDAIGFDQIISGADLIITGEGKVDSQTLTGKTPFGVAQRAHRQNIPVVAIGGCVQISQEDASEAGFAGVYQVSPSGMPLEEAMRLDVASKNVYDTTLKILKEYE